MTPARPPQMYTKPKAVLGVGLAGALIAGCGGGSHLATKHDASPTTGIPATAAVRSACPASPLPGGLVLDQSRSGSIQPSDYTSSGDLEAAMLYDGYVSGWRAVYTDPQATGDQSALVECIELSFPSASAVHQFYGSYQQLRGDEAPVAVLQRPAPVVGTGSAVAYRESDQDLSDYGIPSTTVLETSLISGARFDSVLIAGTDPDQALAVRLLDSMDSAQ